MSEIRNYDQELCELYKIVCEELSDLNLKNCELQESFLAIISLIILPRLDRSHPDMQTEIFMSPDKCNIETLMAFRGLYNNKDVSDIVPSLSEYNLCNNQRLSKILSRFLESNSLPSYDMKSCQDYLRSIRNGKWVKAASQEQAYYRGRKMDNGEIKWSLVSLNGNSKEIPNAAYVWSEKQGLCRFITTKGQWGYIDTNTFTVILLPENIVMAHDFCDYRALVLASEEFAQEIDIRDNFPIDYNPYKLYWAHIDMRGNIIKKYTQASEYKDNIATVSLKEGDFWGFMNDIEQKYKNPYKNIEVDIMGNPLPKYQQIINETLKNIEEDKRNKELDSDFVGSDYDDEESIMEALENGYGDIYGF